MFKRCQQNRKTKLMSQVKDTSAKSSMVQKMKYRKVKSKAEEINSAEKHVSDMFSFENF